MVPKAGSSGPCRRKRETLNPKIQVLREIESQSGAWVAIDQATKAGSYCFLGQGFKGLELWVEGLGFRVKELCQEAST